MNAKKTKLCIDYVCTSEKCFLDCYYLDADTESIIDHIIIDIESVKLPEVSNVTMRDIAQRIIHGAAERHLKPVGSVNFLVSSKEIFSNAELFPNIKRKLMIKYNKRDLEVMFPSYNLRNAYIENKHNDGTLGTIIFTTFCPLTIIDQFELLAKELKLKLGYVSSSNYSLAHRYEKFYKEEITHGVIIDIEEHYTLIDIFINGTLVDHSFIEGGSTKIKANDEKLLSIIHSRTIAVVAKHEYELEKFPATVIKICSSDALAAKEVHDKLTEVTKFEVGYTVANPLVFSTFPSKYSFKKYKVNPFKINFSLKANTNKGFTLVEVVVSLAIFSILTGVCLGAIVPMINVVERSKRDSAIGHIVSDISEVYRQHSSDFRSVYYTVNGNGAPVVFDSESKRFDYNADFELVSQDGTYYLEYTINENADLVIDSFIRVDTNRNLISPVVVKGMI